MQLPYTYIQSEKYLFTVGHYSPAGWIPESDHDSVTAAAARAHYLNGGNDADMARLLDDLCTWLDNVHGDHAMCSICDTKREAKELLASTR